MKTRPSCYRLQSFWLFVAIGLALPAAAPGAGANVYLQHALVSNTPGAADFTDPNLVDPWAIAISATSPFWVSDHLNGTATIYTGAGTVNATVVTIAPSKTGTSPGKPTGQVANLTPTTPAAFVLANGARASFIFSTEDGTIQAWNGGTVAQTMVDNSGSNAVYKGLAMNPSATAPLIYAANFRSGKIDVFNTTFQPTSVPGGFTDANLPAGFAPFNIQALNGNLYVAYAKQDSNQFLDVAGAGNGYVDVFDFNGNLQKRLVSGGALNSPWGLAIAPPVWGAFGGDLLVGNFGDGKINAFDPNSGNLLGTLQDANGNPLVLSGLWAIVFGNGGNGGDPNTLYYVAGVPNGTTVKRGVLGSIAPPAAISTMFNAARRTDKRHCARGNRGDHRPDGRPFAASECGSPGDRDARLDAELNERHFQQCSGARPLRIGKLYGRDRAIRSGWVCDRQCRLEDGNSDDRVFPDTRRSQRSGLFTSNGGGTGQVLAINQDGTVNSATPANPAAKGSVVVLFATGEGVTDPPGTDGLITLASDFLRIPVASVSLTIGAQTAQVLYAGSSPGSVAGLMEIEAVVPNAAASGNDAVVLTIGGATSQANVTIAVK